MLMTDNATTFQFQEFQVWCKQWGTIHLTEVPYHQITNNTAKCLIKSFKQTLRKSLVPPKKALQEFLVQHIRIYFWPSIFIFHL